MPREPEDGPVLDLALLESLLSKTITPIAAAVDTEPDDRLEEILRTKKFLNNLQTILDASTPVTGAVTGAVAGVVTGKVAGVVTGKVTGTVTGAVTGAVTGNIKTTQGATPFTSSLVASGVVFKAPAVPVKTAPIDTILFDDDSVPYEIMTDLIFEDIGGQELINISRSDIINGQKISYQPIKNLTLIERQYNPNNILGFQKTSDKYFAGFAIKLAERIPEVGNGADGSHVYSEDGGIVIELVNLLPEEQVEVEISTDAILYEMNFGESVP